MINDFFVLDFSIENLAPNRKNATFVLDFQWPYLARNMIFYS